MRVYGLDLGGFIGLYGEDLRNLFAPGDLIASFSMLRVLRLARIIRPLAARDGIR